MPSVLITGANRGIGLAFVQAYAERGWSVIAAVRDLSKMPDVPGIKVIKIEVDSLTDAKLAIEALGLKELDLVIANAGVNISEAPVKDLDLDDYDLTWKVNVRGPLILFQAVYPLLERAKEGKYLVISSDRGSIGQKHMAGEFAYGQSKAAVNFMISKLHYEHPDIVFLAINPGWVSTPMGDATAAWQGIPKTTLQVSDTLPSVMKLIEASKKDTTSGTFMHYDGTPLPW
ncbi:MAG: hypothetical protein TREMPRED_004438 [Tremellales sp. Tagirdzhanova-0007]|nr:MAG: hypothetical protein TREMPRED_004438 [Tremellales sp. Tagirdzhanova-0007]